MEYGETTKYQNWIKKSLVGFKMAPKQDHSSRTSGSSSIGGDDDKNNKEDEA